MAAYGTKLLKIRAKARDGDRARLVFPKGPNAGEWAQCGLLLRYSAYDERWRAWFVALDGAVISGPMKLVPGIDIALGHKTDPRTPQGQLFCYAKDRQPPTAETIDTEAQLLYRRASA